MMDKVALITGSTDGIGKGLALDLARRGCTLHVLGRNRERGGEMLERLRQIRPGQPHRFFPVDLSTVASNQEFLDAYTTEHDQLDLLILNANAYAKKTSMTSDGIEQTFAVGGLSKYIFSVRLSPLLAHADDPRVAHLGMAFYLPNRIDFEGARRPGMKMIPAQLQTFLAVALMVRFFNREGLSRIPHELHDPGVVMTKQVDDHPWWMRIQFRRANPMGIHEFGQILGHHLATTRSADGAGEFFQRGRFVPAKDEIVEGKDQFERFIRFCEERSGIPIKEMV